MHGHVLMTTSEISENLNVDIFEMVANNSNFKDLWQKKNLGASIFQSGGKITIS